LRVGIELDGFGRRARDPSRESRESVAL